MLQIHFSNRYEVLTALLLQRLAVRRGDAFTADQVVVPSAAVRRSLTLALADGHGICANVEFPFLAHWLWQQMGIVGSAAQAPPFEPAVLAWRVYAALGDGPFVGAHPRLAAYLRGADDVMRFELAGRVAALFDHYATYRPEWLAAWRAGRSADCGARSAGEVADERWQAALWRQTEGAGAAAAGASDRTDPAAAFASALHGLTPLLALGAGLPESVHVFALPTMPPLYMAWLQQLGRLIDVQLYVLNPCQEYWFELVDRRRLSHLAAQGRADRHEVGNRLLAAWGRQTQALVDGLVDSGGDGISDDAAFEPNPDRTLLAQWQNAVLELRELEPGSLRLAADDRSVEVHVCHSLARELEVLHDHLLGLLASGAVQHPSQVLVVTPDLDAAAPLIDAVFGTAPRDRQLPYAITGRSRSQANAPARALLGLLALAGSRFGASEVFGALQQDIVARRFGLSADDLQRLHRWLIDCDTRWGLDADHRAGFDVPATAAHTWAAGLDRLFLGYALPDRVGAPFSAMLPAGDAEGSAALALGALWRFVDRLRALHAALAVERTPAAWQTLLLDALATFVATAGDSADDLRELQSAIAELTATMQRGLGAGAAGGGNGSHGGHVDDIDGERGRRRAPTLPLALVRAALQQQLDDPARGGVPGGGVTFSAISSLRSLPYAVVCVVGLDDGAYPTARPAAEFDLMALQPRRGDRQRRVDERNVFLDLLLAARHSVYLSHTGRSVRDNATLPPSVLIAELLDVLVPAIAAAPTPAGLADARVRLVVEHPLQPFSLQAFRRDADPRLRSFNRELADALQRSLQAAAVAPPAPSIAISAAAAAATAAAAAAATAAAADAGAEIDVEVDDDAQVEALPAFFRSPLPPPAPEWHRVSLDQLIEFFRNPCRYLLRRRLGIHLGRSEDQLQDDEPFLPDWHGRTAFAARLLPALLEGASADAVRALADAGTEMPAGPIGRHQREVELESLQRFAGRVRELTAAPALPPRVAEIDFAIEGQPWQLVAAFADLRADGLVGWRYDARRGVDVLADWITHLALCAAAPPAAAARSRWLTLDGTTEFGPVADAPQRLLELLALYRRGLSEPLEFFPRSAWKYIVDGGSLNSAAQAWTPSRERPYSEGADAAYRLALRGRGDPLAGEFAALASAVFGPVLAAQPALRDAA